MAGAPGTVAAPRPMRRRTTARQGVDHLLGRGLRLVGETDRAREHVGGAAGERCQRDRRPGQAAAGFVQGAVTGEDRDHVVPGLDRVAASAAAWPRRVVSATSTV